MRCSANLFALFLALLVIVPSLSAAQSLMPTTGGSAAQSATTLEDPDSPEAVREMVARMSDDEVRSLLLERLDAVAAENAGKPDEQATLIAFLRSVVDAFVDTIWQAVVRLPILFESQIEAFVNFGEKHGGSGLAMMLGVLVLAIAAGRAVEWVIGRLTRSWQGDAEIAKDDSSLWAAVTYLFRRFCRELLGLVGFYFVSRAVASALLTPDQLNIVGPFLMLMVILPRIGKVISRFILAPNSPQLRLVSVTDEWASYLHRHMVGLFLLIGFSIFIVLFNSENGVPMGQTRIGMWLNLAVHLYVVYIAIRAREALVQLMRGDDPDRTDFDEKIATLYPGYAILVSLVTWGIVSVLAGFERFDLLSQAPHYRTMILLLLAPAFDTLIRALVRHLLPPMVGEGQVAEEAYRSTKRSYIRIGRVLVIGIVILTVANIWDIDLTNLAAAGVGAQLAGRLVEFSMIIGAGYLVWEVVSLWVNQKLADEKTALGLDLNDEEMSGGEGGGLGGSRLATILPLALNTARVVIVVVFALLALGSLGIDTTPLLAGAGIVGLAVGFGAQKLVTDVVSGVFFLVDDAFRTGEYVEVEGTMGTVERISIRSMQLRHHRGPIHTIPYGEIPKITNFSRDWVIMKLKFTVPFDTDPNKVKKIFKKIGQEMMELPEFAGDFLQPFKSQGVFQIDDVGMVMRGKFMAKPGKQFTLRKEIYNRVKAAFEENDIQFARREVRVAIPGLDNPEEMDEGDRAAISAAAAQAVQEQIEKDEEAEKK